jgi:hypothetical protein
MNTHGESMIELPLLVPVLWVSLASYVIWFVGAAKRHVPLTLEEAKMLWKIHKQDTNCRYRRWQPISRRNGKITGFKCECGYKYTQKRPVVSRIPKRYKSQKLNPISKPSEPSDPLTIGFLGSSESTVIIRKTRRSKLNIG